MQIDGNDPRFQFTPCELEEQRVIIPTGDGYYLIRDTSCPISSREGKREECLRVLNQRIAQMTQVKPKNIKKMQELLVWKDEFKFMRPKVRQVSNGLSSYQAFWDWDTKGVLLPEWNDKDPDLGVEDPEVLEDLVQSKRCREFQIDQWVETYKLKDEYMIWPEEYFGHLGMDMKLFQKLFRRDPCPEILSTLVEDGAVPRREDVLQYLKEVLPDGYTPVGPRVSLTVEDMTKVYQHLHIF